MYTHRKNSGYIDRLIKVSEGLSFVKSCGEMLENRILLLGYEPFLFEELIKKYLKKNFEP